MTTLYIKARAPSRIGIAGGGSDLPAFFERHGGAVLNVAIDLYSYTKMCENGHKATKIISHDWGITREITDTGLEFDANPKENVDIIKAVMKECGLDPRAGYEILIHSMAPKNSGLAGSSALLTSLLLVMSNVAGKPILDRKLLAETAIKIERDILKRKGGHQDQYASVFGGFNFIEFSKGKTKEYPLRLQEDLIAELHSAMMLFETPYQRTKQAHEIEKRKEEDVEKEGESVEHLKNIRDYAYKMKEALIGGDLQSMGEYLHQSWLEKQKLPGVSDGNIQRLYEIARQNGAYGGKLCGAGAGGFLFIISEISNRKRIINALKNEGANLVNFDFDFKGAITWRTAY
jgi:D-glycero-alpha-D-manno-heptose-7-phosphate kinase